MSFMLQIWMKLMVLMLLMMSNLTIMTMMMILMMIRPGEGGTFCWLVGQELCLQAGGQHSSASIIPGELCRRGLPPPPPELEKQRVLHFANKNSETAAEWRRYHARSPQPVNKNGPAAQKEPRGTQGARRTRRYIHRSRMEE